MRYCRSIPIRREEGLECTLNYYSYNDTTNTSCVNWNQYYTNCSAGEHNPFKGAINFDNIGYAWIAIFQVITLEGWVDIMYFVMDAHSFYNFIYFILLIIRGEIRRTALHPAPVSTASSSRVREGRFGAPHCIQRLSALPAVHESAGTLAVKCKEKRKHLMPMLQASARVLLDPQPCPARPLDILAEAGSTPRHLTPDSSRLYNNQSGQCSSALSGYSLSDGSKRYDDHDDDSHLTTRSCALPSQSERLPLDPVHPVVDLVHNMLQATRPCPFCAVDTPGTHGHLAGGLEQTGAHTTCPQTL
ncbi:UNVERIFIED_CONTAM: hypothetical protein K2H54_017697 [Gekko kuhli]